MSKTKPKIKQPHIDQHGWDEIGRAKAEAREIEQASLSERQESRNEFTEAMRDPALVAERIGWLIDGNYGYGQMLEAKRIIASPRMNRRAALTHLVGIYEWRCPVNFGIDAWKRLSRSEQQALDAAVDIVIAAAEQEMLQEQAGG